MNIAGGMPPAFRNHRAPTASGTPAAAPASSLDKPAAIAAQNCRRSSRPATGGRPGDDRGFRPDRPDRRFRMVIANTSVEVLRRPLESAQYACGDYITLLERHGIQPSMSRAGCPYDNAMAESFMKTLKQEEVDGTAYRDIDHARAAIGTFFEDVYNRHRLHSALAYRPPAEFEANLPPTGASALKPPSAVPATCP
jgi:putative transposase